MKIRNDLPLGLFGNVAGSLFQRVGKPFFPAERIGVAVQLGEPDAVHGPYHLLRVGDGVVVHTDELRGNPPRNGDAGHHQNPERPEQQHETQKGAAYPLVHGGKNNHDALT